MTPHNRRPLKTLAIGLLLLAAAPAMAADTDGDGLPDAWESEHFGNLDQGPDDDFDRDGRTNAEELADNTNPANPGSTLGLVAYYPLDGNATDSSQRGNHGLLMGTTPAVDRHGANGGAMAFNGNDCVDLGTTLAGMSQEEVTVTAWVFTGDNLDDHGKVFYLPSLGEFSLGAFGSNRSPRNAFSVYVGNGTDNNLASAPDSDLHTGWKMIAGTAKRSGNLRLFVDGMQVGESILSANAFSVATPYNKNSIGAYRYSSSGIRFSYYGLIDDVRIYSRALSSNEVARLYASTSPQPTTHLVTLHPGDHGSIPGANSGTSFVTNIAHGAAFPAVTPDPDAGWTFTGWNPPAPATVTNDFTATAGYEAEGQHYRIYYSKTLGGISRRIEYVTVPGEQVHAPFAEDGWNRISPAMSPNRTRLAFVRYNSQNSDYAVCLSGLDGQDEVVLYSTAFSAWSVEWHPSGNSLIVVIRNHSSNDNRDGTVYSIDVASGVASPLTAESDWTYQKHHAAVSPDGTRFCFNRNAQPVFAFPQDLWIMNMDGSQALKLTNYGDGDGNKVWRCVFSPDGSSILHNKGDGTIRSVNVDGSNNVVVPELNGDSFSGKYSNDGRYIVFVKRIGGSFHPAYLDLATRAISTISSVSIGHALDSPDMVLLSQGSTTHTVTFDLDGKGERTGGGALVQQVAHGGAAVAPTVSGLPGWTFTDWDRAFDNVTGPLTVTARYTATPRPDLTLLPSDLRILNASGAETANPAIGERVTLEVTVRNTGAAATSGDILVQLFLDGAPADLVRYDLASYSNVASTVVVESMEVGGSRTLLLPWIATGPDRVATLTAVAEFAANRTQSQANAEGASSPLPVAEAAFDNNATGRSLQLGSPAAGDFGIEVLCTPPSNLLSGVGYPLAGTARYDWGANAPVLGALVTVTVSNQTHTARTVPPDGAWSVTLNGLPAGEHLARVTVSDGRLTGATNLTLLVSAGPETRDLRIADLGFEIGTYRTEGETGYAVTGSDVVVRARVRNDGNAACGAFDVAFKDPSGGVLCTVAVPGGLAAFSETTVIATAGWAAQAGAHQISAVADSGGAVDETNENNNTRVCTVVGTAALPDLIVTGLGFAPGGPKAGDAVTMTATVKNQGAAAVAAGTTLEVAFSVAGATVATGTVAPPSGLAPGASLTVAATHTFAAAGTFAVGVLADSGGAVAETREDNNALAATLSVRQALPDLRPFYMPNGWTTVSGLSFSPSQPVAGEAVTVSCDLYNSGTMPLEADAAFNVVFSADGAPFATHRVTLAADLAAGASVRTAAAWSGGAAGSVTFAAAVDTGNEVAEEHETNNGTSAGLTVYPGGAALVAAGLTTSPLQPLPGAAVTLTATVRNDGGAAGGDGAVVEFFAGSTAPADKLGETALAGDAAAKGGTRTAEFAWRAPATPGVVPLFAKIGDSTVLRNLTVTANPAPNLQVFSEDIRVVPILPQSGEAVTVTATVRNTEGSAATGFWVHFYRDVPGGFWVDLGAPVQVASLAAGAETTVTAGAQIVADRSAYTLKVELRPNTAQGDADAGDNIATSSFLLADTPRADAGADAACFAGQPVALDGTASSNATTYAWTLVEWPAGSEAVLTGADTATPTLTPDLPGLYRLQLVVGDGLVQSDPDTVEVTARWLELTVASAHGTPVPGVGTHALSWMTVVGGRSTSVDEVGPGTRYLCTGWTGTGSVAPHGATTNVSFAITNDSSIVWNWATNHWLAAETAGGSGWLSETGAWHAAGSEASVSAVADDGWRFDRWVVDGQPAEAGTTSSTNGTNTVTDVMDAPKDLTAVFAALDLPEALDNGGRIWTTGGSSNWVGQTRTTFDGEDAAGSGETGDNAQSWLETTVETGGTLRFAWRVSSEAQRDLLRFEVDGQVYGLISGETAWQTVTVSVPYGEHTFRWVYAKGKSGAAGADRGWVDQVVWAPLPPLTLAIAVDATNLVWTTAGDAAWFPQTEVTADGVAAAQSGAVGDLGWSGLTTRVRGSGLLAFEWRVSSEEEYDWLVLLVDGVVQRAVTGESGWQRVQLALEGDGDHELRWEYWKDERLSEGLDAGWLDRVSWSGAVPPEEPPALVGFALWADGRGLAGDAAAIFGQLHPVTGVPYGFEYAFGGSLTPGVPLLTIRLVDGRPVVETPAQDAATLPYVDVRVVGTEDLAAGDWTLPVAPAADTTGKPANRAWHEPAGTPPDKAFFRLEAGLK